VLKAIGLSDQAAFGSLRLSMGRATTLEEVTEVRALVRDLVERIRLVTAPEDIGKCKDDCPCFVTG
jgi:cysteine desulfurase